MGNKSGKIDGDEAMTVSSSGRGVREGLSTWHRKGVEVTDVYEIKGVLGSGLMGEVYRVKRKEVDRGVHNSKTRAAAAAALNGATETKEKGRGKNKILKKSFRPKSIIAKDKKSKDQVAELAAAASEEPAPKLPPPSNLPKPKSILREPSRGASKGARKTSVAVADGGGESDDGSSVGSASSQSSTTGSQRKTSTRTIRFAREYACKTVSTARVKTGQLQELLNEIYVMRTLDHPYILRLYEVYQVKRKLWLITEFCSGGDLTSRKMDESRVTVVLEQILRAVAYMHLRGILHRDLKLENIMFENGGYNASIRLIDFGLSKTFDRAVQGRKAIGTAYTLSPEIAKDKNAEYTEKTEVWSIGIIAWILLAGDFPFLKEEDDLNNKEMLNDLLQAKYRWGTTWKGRGITVHGKDFVRNTLRLKPEDRWSVNEALEFVQNTWIPALEAEAEKYEDKEMKRVLYKATGTANSQQKLSGDMDALGINTEDIELFCKSGLLKKTILTTLAHTMDREDAVHLRELFLMADTEDTGTISLLELKGALRKIDTDIDDETVERMFTGIDQDKSGQIHYAEFLAALAESQGLVTMERLAEAFDRIDADGKGYISHDDLKDVLGDDYDKEIVDKMIEEADFKKNGQVDYEEFLELMFGDPETGLKAAGDVSSALEANVKFQGITDSLRSTGSIRELMEANVKDEDVDGNQ